MERREFLKKSALAALGTAVAGTGIVQAFDHINDNESKTGKMKIVVLTGSPRKNGNSAYLAEQFIKGAEEKGTRCSVSTVRSSRWSRAAPATAVAWMDLVFSTMTFRNSVRT